MKLPADITVIYVKMSMRDQIKVVTYVMNMYKDKNADKSACSDMLRNWLEKEFKGTWHVGIINGSYWFSYSHLPDNTFHFVYKNICFVMWKTNS